MLKMLSSRGFAFLLQNNLSSCVKSCEFLTLLQNFSSIITGDGSTPPTPGIPTVTNKNFTSVSLKWDPVRNTTGTAVYLIEIMFGQQSRFFPRYSSQVSQIVQIFPVDVLSSSTGLLHYAFFCFVFYWQASSFHHFFIPVPVIVSVFFFLILSCFTPFFSLVIITFFIILPFLLFIVLVLTPLRIFKHDIFLLYQVFVSPQATLIFEHPCAYTAVTPFRSEYTDILFRFKVAVLTENSSVSYGPQTVQISE